MTDPQQRPQHHPTGPMDLVHEYEALRDARAERGRASKAGRDLPAAILVGILLLGVVLVGLFWFPIAFIVVVTMFAVVGCWEVSRAFQLSNTHVPMIPLVLAAAALPVSAALAGPEGLGFATITSITVLLFWNVMSRPAHLLRSLMAGTFTALWVPLMISFAVLLFNEQDGHLKVATLLLLVVSNDTFGYLVGAMFGKHPMAPKISPKKSWEGFAGSVGGAIIVGIAASLFLLNTPWWTGLLLAVATVAAATTGDLAESLVKRELGIKDMSNILPGHGGVMDRLDSIVFASPVAYVLALLTMPGSV
ncbi:phosphatidate cytidylyltransferase [Neomicrococcus lactis]|uniref:Phosphatidate cytidylyltransferase n=2 Tax=Neomicrococcus lactis TaxID=732241 RepID=A0A7W9DB24_9MICC|nr:phosphatidate cytidylyltransferase [Neomicrococcus lactis]